MPQYLDSLVPPSQEEFTHIAQVQAERELQVKRRSREIHRQSISSQQGFDNAEEQEETHDHHSQDHRPGHGRKRSLLERLGLSHGHHDDGARQKAATTIQRTYRGYRARREMQGYNLDASSRWTQAVREAQWRALTRPRARTGDPTSDGPFDARNNWRKVSVIARRAGADEDSDTSSISSSSSSSSSSSGSERKRAKEQRKKREEAKKQRREDARMMGLQYFLEMVDLKHRYGANLRVYHEEWKKSETNENFFYWLDYGEGRLLDIEACPRERLDREQVRYLNREERQYYLVKVDDKGRLCWAKNGVRIDTTEKFKDSIHGIVPADDETPAFRPISENDTRLLGDSSTGSSGSTSDSSRESHEEAMRAGVYATPSLSGAKGVKKIKHVSAATIFNTLLRKSVRKNTWIFVADTSFRLYVGIKNSGAFQHSSFLQGSRISAAGLIRIKDGRLTSLSPLSGHYRPPASNFRAFVKSLKEEGVDMGRTRVSKSYAILVGLETYVKVQKKGKDVLRKITHKKQKVVAPEEPKKDQAGNVGKEEEEDAFLAEEERVREENAVEAGVVQAMQKLGVSAREPKGQKGGGDHEEEKAAAADVGQ